MIHVIFRSHLCILQVISETQQFGVEEVMFSLILAGGKACESGLSLYEFRAGKLYIATFSQGHLRR